MSIFKAALRVAANHRIYFIIYLIALSSFGIPILFSGTSADSSAHETYDARIAVIDRDGSTISQGLAQHLDGSATLVQVDDDTYAIQDALAQSSVDAVVVVDQGFGEELIDAVHTGGEMPALDVAYGTDMQSGALAVTDATSWLSLVARAAALDPTAAVPELIAQADDASGEKAATQLSDVASAEGGTDAFTGYLAFNSYALFVTIVVCVGLVMVRFNGRQIRHRTDASPQTPARINRAVMAAGLTLTVIVWAWVACLSLALGSDALEHARGLQVVISLAAMFAYCLTPLALAFTLAQIGASEQMLNAIGNIFGLASAFFSGAWVPLELMGPSVQALARFTPAFWYNDAMASAFAASDWSAVAGRVGTDFAMLALFAVVTALIGVAASRVGIHHAVGAARTARTAGQEG